MVSARDFLIRGLLVGLLAGLVAFGVAYAVGEPAVNAAIALEESGPAGHSHPEGTDPTHGHSSDGTTGADGTTNEVPRSLQSTLGLATGTLVAGATLGGLLGVLSALGLGRFGRLGPRATALLLTGVGFVAVTVVPFLAYPPNPPAVGSVDTIGYRTALFFLTVAISVISAVTAVIVARTLAATWGPWYATLAAVAGYLAVTLIAVALLPTANEVPADFPATVLYDFRLASFAVQLTLWSVLGVAARRVGAPAHRAPHPYAGRRHRLRRGPGMIDPPAADAYAAARHRLDALAKPTGALGRLEELAAWVASCQGECPPRPLDRVRAVLLAGDHGVSQPSGSAPSVSAYPREVTPAMVRLLVCRPGGGERAGPAARRHAPGPRPRGGRRT